MPSCSSCQFILLFLFTKPKTILRMLGTWNRECLSIIAIPNSLNMISDECFLWYSKHKHTNTNTEITLFNFNENILETTVSETKLQWKTKISLKQPLCHFHFSPSLHMNQKCVQVHVFPSPFISVQLMCLMKKKRSCSCSHYKDDSSACLSMETKLAICVPYCQCQCCVNDTCIFL